MKNKFSFISVPKSNIFSKSIENEESSDSLFSDPNYEYISLYMVNDESIIQEYCFENGNTTLYCDNGNNTLSVLYEYKADDGVISLYTPNGMYIAKKEDSKIKKVVFLDENAALSISKSLSKNSMLSFPFRIGKSVCTAIFNSTSILANNSVNSPEMYDEFNKLYLKYSAASNYIPAGCIINSILDNIIHYTATKELDKDKLLNDYIKLQNFQELCYDSIQLIASFTENPSKADLRSLSDNLSRNSSNISKLIDLYLDNVLNYDENNRTN